MCGEKATAVEYVWGAGGIETGPLGWKHITDK